MNTPTHSFKGRAESTPRRERESPMAMVGLDQQPFDQQSNALTTSHPRQLVTYKNVGALHSRISVARVEVIGEVVFIFETI